MIMIDIKLIYKNVGSKAEISNQND